MMNRRNYTTAEIEESGTVSQPLPVLDRLCLLTKLPVLWHVWRPCFTDALPTSWLVLTLPFINQLARVWQAELI